MENETFDIRSRKDVYMAGMIVRLYANEHKFIKKEQSESNDNNEEGETALKSTEM
jgi:hypothetical protein